MSAVTAPAPGTADLPDTTPRTIPGWLLQQARVRPRAVALRVKDLGRWCETTWSEYAERVAGVGRALESMGVKSGDRVAIVSGNRAEWIITDLAVQGLGAVSVSVSAMTAAETLGEQLVAAGVKVAIVEDEEQFDKVTEASDRLSLAHVVVIDPRGIRRLEGTASSFEGLEALGSADAVRARSGDPEAWANHVATLDPGAVAAIMHTSGTTADPKPVELTHQALNAAAASGREALGLRAGDEIVSTLPLSDIAERTLTVGQAVQAGAVVSFGEGGLSLGNDLREVRPTVMLGSPRVWERLRENIEAGARGAGLVKRGAMRAARKKVLGVSSVLVRRPLRSNLGLSRTRIAVSATAPCAPDVVEYWRSLGVPLRQAYSLTEAGGFAAIAGPDDPAGSVGRPVEGMHADVSSGNDAEIVLSCAERFPRGPFRTGDVGSLVDGVLTITGRGDEMVTASGGRRVAPRAIEAALEASQYIRTAAVVGDGRPCLGALIVIDATAVGDWAGERGESFTTFTTLSALPAVRALVGTEVEKVNATLDAASKVGCFAVLARDISDDDELVTDTDKLRRGPIAARFAETIDAMYAGRSSGGAS